MGYLVGNDAPMVWRGPMASSAVQQLTLETEWIDLDYLLSIYLQARVISN